jgi:hypothetical protein
MKMKRYFIRLFALGIPFSIAIYSAIQMESAGWGAALSKTEDLTYMVMIVGPILLGIIIEILLQKRWRKADQTK